MHPVLLDLSEHVKVYAFGTFIVLAFLVSAWYVRREAARRLGVDKELSFHVCFLLLVVALAGARLLYVMLRFEHFAERPMSFLFIWEGGLVWYGGLLAALLWLSWYVPRRPALRGWAFLDVLALGTCLSMFVGRFASFLSGENYGREAPDLAWAVTFPPHPHTQVPPALIGRPLHPAQLYHGLHGLVLFAILLLLRRRGYGPGALAGAFLALYAAGRFWIEVYRGDDQERGMLLEGWISTSQAISIPVFFLGVALFFLRKPKPQTGPAPLAAS